MQLAEEELTVNEIAAQHHMSLQAVSKHLKVLENAELIVKRRAGRIDDAVRILRPLSRLHD